MRRLLKVIILFIVLILTITLVGYAQDQTIEKYENAKRITEEKLSKLLKAIDELKQSSKNQTDSKFPPPEFEKLNKLRKEFEEAFVNVTLFMPKEYALDHDQWAKGILRKLKEKGLR